MPRRDPVQVLIETILWPETKRPGTRRALLVLRRAAGGACLQP